MLKIQYTDLLLPGNGGLDIKVMRTYDSAGIIQPGVGGPPMPTMGLGWNFTFGQVIGSYVCYTANPPAYRPIFLLPDGSQQKFYKAPTGFGHLYVSKEGWVADCANSPNGGGLIVSSPDGTKYQSTVHYAYNGVDYFNVNAITDFFGFLLTFQYQLIISVYLPVSCSSSDGRLVTFSYTGSALTQITANGQTWTYDYVTFDGRPISSSSNYGLATVTRPDGKKWSYTYPTFPTAYSPLIYVRGYMGQVTRPDGGANTYKFTYVSAMGTYALRMTSKSVTDNINPVSNWTYRYTFWQSDPDSAVGVSVTDVADPVGGLTTYKHETPYASNTASAWRVGLLLDKLKCSSSGGTVLTCTPANATQREQFTWGSQLVSPDVYLAYTGVMEPYTDQQTNRPLLTNQTITRDGTTYVTQYQSHDAYGNPARVVETGNGTTRTTDLTYYNDPVKWITGVPDEERSMAAGSWIARSMQTAMCSPCRSTAFPRRIPTIRPAISHRLPMPKAVASIIRITSAACRVGRTSRVG